MITDDERKQAQQEAEVLSGWWEDKSYTVDSQTVQAATHAIEDGVLILERVHERWNWRACLKNHTYPGPQSTTIKKPVAIFAKGSWSVVSIKDREQSA